MSFPATKGASLLLILLLSHPLGADIRDTNKQGQWKIFSIELGGSASSPAIAIGPTGQTYVTYISDGKLKCRSNRLGHWLTECIGIAGVPDGWWGIDQDAAVDDAGRVHVVYLHLDAGVFTVNYTTDASGAWSGPDQVFWSSQGSWTPSIAVGGDGIVRIALIETSGNTKPGPLLHIHGTLGNWIVDTIAYGASDCAAVAVDHNNNSHVAYYSLGRVNYLTNAPGGNWQAVDNFDWLGGQLEAMKLDIAVDSAGRPHVSYVGQSMEDNKYAVNSGGVWEMVTLDSGGFSSAGNAIAVDREGHAHICYYHKPSSLIKYASNESGSWAIDTICPGTWMVIPVSIAVDNQSYPHVCTDDNVYATTAPLPAISIRPPAVDFGLVRLGGTKTDSVYLVSTGDTAAVVSDLSFSGANPDDYRVMCDCSTIVPGDSCLVGVMFTPDSVGGRDATLRVHSNAFAGPSLPLTGQGWTEYTSWIQTFDAEFGHSEHGTSIRPTEDGGCVIAGGLQTGNSRADCDGWVLRLDTTGTPIWQVRLGGEQFDLAEDVCQTTDGGYVVVGETESFPQAGFDPSAIWMVKLDSLGAIAWQRQYAGTEPRHGWAVQQTFDGGYLSADTKGHIIKVDSVGSLQWQRDFKSVIESVSLTADSGFVLCLLTYAFTTDDPLYGTAWFVKVTRNGEIEWQKYYHPGHAPWSLIRPAPDGGFVAWVYTKPGNVILKLDSTGTPEWSKRLGGHWDELGGLPTEIGFAPDSGCVLFWGTQILKLTEAGACDWASSLPISVFGAAITPGGGSVVTGIWEYWSNEPLPKGVDLWAGLLDTGGLVLGCELITQAGVIPITDVTPGIMTAEFTPDEGSLQSFVTDGMAYATAAEGVFHCAFDPIRVDGDGDGISDAEEMGPGGADPNYDGNTDGIADAQQNSVASFGFLNGKYGTLAAEPGAVLEDAFVYPAAVGCPEPPAGVDFLYDLLGFRITGLSVGQATSVTLFLPDGESFDSYYKYGSTWDNQTAHWYEFAFDGETGAELNGNVITLHFVDGIRGDDDLVANGMVTEPGGPTTLSSVDVRDDQGDILPYRFELSQNYPNPFNPVTTIEYSVPRRAQVTIEIFNVLGQKVRTLVNESKGAGSYRMAWNGANEAGNPVATGVYLYRFQAGDVVQTKKMLLIK